MDTYPHIYLLQINLRWKLQCTDQIIDFVYKWINASSLYFFQISCLFSNFNDVPEQRVKSALFLSTDDNFSKFRLWHHVY